MACESVNKCCFSGRGKIYLAKYDACCGTGDEGENPYPLLYLGNVTAFTIDATVNTQTIEDMTSPSGGNVCMYSEVADPVVNMDITCLDADNMAKAFAAQATTIAAATAVAQATNVRAKGAFIPFEFGGRAITNAKPSSVVVKAGPVATEVTLTAGVDYEATAGGVLIFESSPNLPAFPAAVAPATITPGVEIRLTFDHGDVSLLDILTQSGQEYSLYFDGLNAAAGGAPFNGHLFRIKPRPATGIPFLSKEIARWSMTADILRDGCQTGGASSYGTFGF
ncbi:MAG: hypothetical protein ACOYB0_08220 [Polynucleobacter sp.]